MELPWKRPELADWRIVGMNHYRISGSDCLFAAMTRDGRVIQAEGADTGAIWDSLADQANTHCTANEAADEVERLGTLIAKAHRLIQSKQYHIAEDILFNRGVRYANEK